MAMVTGKRQGSHPYKARGRLINSIPTLKNGGNLLWRGGLRRRLKERAGLAVAFLLEIFNRHKLQSGGVDAVAQAGRSWPVVEHMPQVRVAGLRADFGAG